MDTPEFTSSLERAMALAGDQRTALLCAEALPWRCHRSLIADALIARGREVLEILNEKDARPRKLPGFARLEGNRVVYDGGELF